MRRVELMVTGMGTRTNTVIDTNATNTVPNKRYLSHTLTVMEYRS